MKEKILVVEDERHIAELIRLYLEKEGFEVIHAADGGAGVAEFERTAPDLVLLDIMLPVMDGWQVLKEIRASSKTPVIMLTAKSETGDKVTGLENGADDYITKPFEVKELIARIHAVMRRKDGETAMEKKLEFDKLTINLDSFMGGGSRTEMTREEERVYVIQMLTRLFSMPAFSMPCTSTSP